MYLLGNACVQQCRTNQYQYYQSKTCENCHEGCASCFGPNLD